jgi:hypothetical protein
VVDAHPADWAWCDSVGIRATIVKLVNRPFRPLDYMAGQVVIDQARNWCRDVERRLADWEGELPSTSPHASGAHGVLVMHPDAQAA